MNLTAVLTHLRNLETVAAGNAKMAYLMASKGDVDLKEFFRLTLDGRHNFFITAPKVMPSPGNSSNFNLPEHLLTLSTRALTGHRAKDYLNTVLLSVTAEGQEVIRRILERDARCGVNSSSVNKVWPGLVFEYDLMKGESLNDYGVGKTYKCPWSGKKDKVISRVGRRASGKLDGRRLEAEKSNGTYQFLSSSGKPVNIADKAIPELITFPIPDNCYIDGELCDKDWNAAMSVTGSGNTSDTWSFQVFGIWTADERWGRVLTSHSEMEKRMLAIIGKGTRHIVIAKDYGIPTTEVEADDMQEAAFRDGLEGIMWKEMDAPYLPYRSQAWLKAKAEETIDVQVVEVEEGEKGKKYEGTMGAFLVEDADGIRFSVGIGKEGSLPDSKRHEFWRDRFLMPGVWIEILQDKVLDKKKIASRFPRFVRVRTDK